MPYRKGNLVLRLYPGETITIGNDISIMLAENQGSGKYARPTRLLLMAPKDTVINRFNENGEPYQKRKKDLHE